MRRKLVVVVSGPPGAGSSTISKHISRKLKIKYFSPGLIQKGLSKTKKEALASLKSWKSKYGSSKKFHTSLDKKQIGIAKKGNVVISGKLSIYFLKNLSDCKIWLDVPLEVRAKRASQRDKISYRKALKTIKDREDIERKRWKEIYGFDYFSLKKKADFVINTSGLSINQSVKRILNFIKK